MFVLSDVYVLHVCCALTLFQHTFVTHACNMRLRTRITTRYAAFRNTAFGSTVALDLIGVPNMQYDDVRLDSVKTVFRVFTPEYRVPKSNFKGLVHIHNCSRTSP